MMLGSGCLPTVLWRELPELVCSQREAVWILGIGEERKFRVGLVCHFITAPLSCDTLEIGFKVLVEAVVDSPVVVGEDVLPGVMRVEDCLLRACEMIVYHCGDRECLSHL
jgi:hypothetical protein